MPPTDEELMLHFAQGDDSAFVQLLTKFKPRLVDFARQIVRDRETGEDIAQEAFLRVFRARGSYRATGKFSSWIHTITANLCYDELRKHRRLVSLESVLGRPPTADDAVVGAAMQRAQAPGPDAQVERKELIGLLDDVLRSLSPEHQQAVALRVHEGLAYAEMAERLGCSVGTAKSRMHYAMKYLRDGLMKRI